MNRRHLTAAVATMLLAGTMLSAAAISDSASAGLGKMPLVHQSSVTRGGRDGRQVGGDTQPMNPCYTQPADGTSNGVLSQIFSAPNGQYTSSGADDFYLASSCTISSMTVPGEYWSPGDTTSNVKVQFYTDAGGQPGSVIAARTVYPYQYVDTQGTFNLAFVNPLTLPGGSTYWVSVQAVGVMPVGDYWFWDTANVTGYPAMFENPGGGYGVCPTWDILLNCVGFTADLAFTLDTSPITVSCYSQLGGTGSPVNSQKLAGASNPQTDLAADDMTVAHDCKILSVDVIGRYFGNSGPAASFKVDFYHDAGGLPAATSYASRNVNPSNYTYNSANGDFHLRLPSSVGLLAGQVNWISVQAAMGGPNKWRWYTRQPQGNKAAWQNVGNGWTTGCVAWTPMLACPGVPGGPNQADLQFSVNTTP